MRRRIHGVPVPPRKKKPDRSNAVTIDFVLVGAVPSKKNRIIPSFDYLKILRILKDLSSQAISFQEAKDRLRTCKPYLRHSKKFYEWEATAKDALIAQAATWSHRLAAKGHGRVLFPISDGSISIYHYWADNKVRDNPGKSETIHDLLVLAGILKDDTWQMLSPTASDANVYSIPDHVTEIKITAYGWLS